MLQFGHLSPYTQSPMPLFSQLGYFNKFATYVHVTRAYPNKIISIEYSPSQIQQEVPPYDHYAHLVIDLRDT